MPHTINFKTEIEQSYSVFIGNNIWSEFFSYCKTSFSSRKIFIVMDENVAPLHRNEIEHQCCCYFKDCHIIKIPAGEASKSRSRWHELLDKLLQNGVERSTPLLAAGGGVTGDLAGFAAASALRGIPLIHMPTTLLAMVDSSIGGKTAINHETGKNLIGSFYQPDAVFTHLPFLRTLPAREWVNGLSEMLKYAAIEDPELFEGLRNALKSGFTPTDEWALLIRECIKIKMNIVQNDVYEADNRVCLNFGHTFAHALEKAAGYGSISHGEAVFVGMLAAAHYSCQLGAPIEMARFNPFKTLYKINLPEENQIDTLIEIMQSDKKVQNQTIRLILLNEWGEPYVKKCRDKALLKSSWKSAFAEINT